MDSRNIFKDTLEENWCKIVEESEGQIYHEVVSALESALIPLALKQTNNNQVRAAKLLGISRNNLRNKMERCGIAFPGLKSKHRK